MKYDSVFFPSESYTNSLVNSNTSVFSSIGDIDLMTNLPIGNPYTATPTTSPSNISPNAYRQDDHA